MSKILSFEKNPTTKEILEIVRSIAETGNISWTTHAKLRLKQRKITIMQVLHCLQKGQITEQPFYSHDNGGGYETRLERVVAGEWLRVVVCLKTEEKLLIVTVIN